MFTDLNGFASTNCQASRRIGIILQNEFDVSLETRALVESERVRSKRTKPFRFFTESCCRLNWCLFTSSADDLEETLSGGPPASISIVFRLPSRVVKHVAARPAGTGRPANEKKRDAECVRARGASAMRNFSSRAPAVLTFAVLVLP